MLNFNPIEIASSPPLWSGGWALDLHTVSSEFLGYNQYGHAEYETKRSEIGEALFRLKYRGDRSVVPGLAEAVAEFIESQKLVFDLIVPMPASNPSKPRQTVPAVAGSVSDMVKTPLCDGCLIKIKETPELKDIFDVEKRQAALKDAFRASQRLLEGKSVLLFDDLYRSGSTARAAASALLGQGKASKIHFIALTCARRNR